MALAVKYPFAARNFCNLETCVFVAVSFAPFPKLVVRTVHGTGVATCVNKEAAVIAPKVAEGANAARAKTRTDM